MTGTQRPLLPVGLTGAGTVGTRVPTFPVAAPQSAPSVYRSC
jgi:hypothetical protein